MELHQLHNFVSVAEHLNFTSAAKELFVSQAAVSKKIAILEEELGVLLFERNKRSVKLTPAGKVFYQEVSDILQKINGAIEKTKIAGSGSNENLKLGYLGPPEIKFLPELLQHFKKKFPHIYLDTHQAYLGPNIKSLEKGELDLIFALSAAISNYPSFNYEKIYSDSYVIICHKDHPIATKTEVHLSSFSNENFIFLNEKSAASIYGQFIQLCSQNGFKPKIYCETDNFEHILMLVKAGMGISIITKSIVSYFSNEEQIREYDIKGSPLNCDVVIAWDKNNNNPCIPLFIKELKVVMESKKMGHNFF